MLKKIALNFLLVGAIVFVLDWTMGKGLEHFYFKEKSGLHFRATHAIETTTADVLVFGSSRANHHYVPEVFEESLNLSFYNTGRDGNGIFYQTAVLKSILSRHKPKVILLDYAGKFKRRQSDYDGLSTLLPYYRTHPEVRETVELRGPFEKIKLLSAIYPYNSLMLTIAIGNTERNFKRKPDNKGYVALYKEWQVEADSAYNIPKYEVDPIKLAYFQEFIAVAKRSGVKVYIVYSPLFEKYDVKQEIQICDSMSKMLAVPFVDYTKDQSFLQDGSLFQDPGHLNHAGASKFSSMLADQIKKDLSIN